MAARIAEASGDAGTAESAYRRVLGKYPDSSAAQAGLAHLLIAQKKYSEAEELLQSAIKKAPEDAALTAQLAAVMVAEDKAEALPLLQKYHVKHPKMRPCRECWRRCWPTPASTRNRTSFT